MCLCGFPDHSPILCIVPPHMLRVLERRGDPALAEMARDLLNHDREFRRERPQARTSPMLRDRERPTGFVTPALADAATAAQARRLRREIYDGERRAALPGRLARAEGDPATGDTEVDRAYEGAGSVHDLYFNEFNRDSLDLGPPGRGLRKVRP